MIITTDEQFVNGHGGKRETGAAISTQTEPAKLFDASVSEMLYLTGRPTLKEFLRFVAREGIGSESEATLVDEWYAAKDALAVIEKEEKGDADAPYMRELDPEDEPLLIEFLKDPIQRANFNAVPSGIELVELDRLVVYQKHIDLTFAEGLDRRIGPAPSREEIFKTCLPYDHPRPPAKWSRVNSDTYTFVSPSNDLRFLGAIPLDSVDVKDGAHWGDVVGYLGLAVGFGSNFMNAVHIENRLILNNGSHRAYALRKMGVTHVPCVVQHVPSRDAIEVVASKEICEDVDLYLNHPRPPMLKDYFNSRLHKVFPFRRRLQQITVHFEVSEADIPIL